MNGNARERDKDRDRDRNRARSRACGVFQRWLFFSYFSMENVLKPIQTKWNKCEPESTTDLVTKNVCLFVYFSVANKTLYAKNSSFRKMKHLTELEMFLFLSHFDCVNSVRICSEIPFRHYNYLIAVHCLNDSCIKQKCTMCVCHTHSWYSQAAAIDVMIHMNRISTIRSPI